MPNERKEKTDARRPEDCPAAWFVVLERARHANDFELAAQARRELERLGVKVTYKPSHSKDQEGTVDNDR